MRNNRPSRKKLPETSSNKIRERSSHPTRISLHHWEKALSDEKLDLYQMGISSYRTRQSASIKWETSSHPVKKSVWSSEKVPIQWKGRVASVWCSLRHASRSSFRQSLPSLVFVRCTAPSRPTTWGSTETMKTSWRWHVVDECTTCPDTLAQFDGRWMGGRERGRLFLDCSEPEYSNSGCLKELFRLLYNVIPAVV